MLHEHKINVDEAEGLLDALEQAFEPVPELKLEYVSSNPQIQKVLDKARKAADSDAPILIVGESGTGREVLARIIHQDSPRRDKPFAAVSSIFSTEISLESELFGYERGAFTGAIRNKMGIVEEIDGSTLFFSEIGDLPMGLQAKMVRFAEKGEFKRIGCTAWSRADVRLIAATSKDLQAEVQAGRFQRDLLDCLSIIVLEVPPLREWPADIPLLADYFLKNYAEQSGRAIPKIAPEAMDMLMSYSWPRNARELSKVMRSAFVLCEDDTIKMEHLPDALTKTQSGQQS